MDYEVFLMSRIHEEWETRATTPTVAVTRGLALTGRVITAAAAIMVTVFASFMLGEERIIKLFGLGLASAVFIDAVIIRSILVPAIMQLLGEPRLVAARLARPDPAPPLGRARRRRSLADRRTRAARRSGPAGPEIAGRQLAQNRLDVPPGRPGQPTAHVDQRFEGPPPSLKGTAA